MFVETGFPPVNGVLACGRLSPCQLFTLSHKISSEVFALPFRMALLNARSITNTTFVLNDIVKTKVLDFLFMTETWQRNLEKMLPLKEICPKDYTFISLPRLSGRGEGLAAAFRNCIFLSDGNCWVFLLFWIVSDSGWSYRSLLLYFNLSSSWSKKLLLRWF